MYYRKPTSVTATIANGATTSDVVHLRDHAMVGLIMPAAFTGTTITFTASDSPTGTFVPVYDSDGNQISVAVAVSRALGLSGAEADALAPFQFVKLVSGSTEGAERLVIVVKK